MPVGDPVRMGLAVEMMYKSITAKGRINNKGFIRGNAFQRPRGTFSTLWKSSPAAMVESDTFAASLNALSLTNYPSQTHWFRRFMQGANLQGGRADTLRQRGEG